MGCEEGWAVGRQLTKTDNAATTSHMDLFAVCSSSVEGEDKW